MVHNLSATLLLSSFVAAFAMAPVAPEAGNVIFLATGAMTLLLMRGEALEVLRRPIAWMPLVGTALIAAAYWLSSGASGLVGVVFFSPLLCIPPLLNAASRADLSKSVVILFVLASCGSTGAAVLAVSDVLATGTTRSGGNIANPIHFADVALLAGFVGLLGVFFAEERFRMVFFAGPAMSIIAVVLSGTRGAVVAASVMIAWVAIMAALTKVIAIRPLILAALATLIAGAVAVALGAASLSGVQRVLVDIVDVVQHGVPTDTSTDQRLQMYLGGLRAFLASPVFGHGPANFTAVANNLADLPFGGAPHLHNDLINMAASAGSLGIAAYLIIILAPLVEILTLPNTIAKSRLLVGVTGLLAGYVVMGLTNAMFGILTITIMFTAICVLSGLMARGIRGAEVGESNLERQPVTSPAPRLTSG